MAAKKRTKKLFLSEFNAWLEGVEELQPVDWSPTADQWKLIRNKIRYIKEDVHSNEAINNNVKVAGNPVSSIPLSPVITPPPITGGIPAQPVNMSPAAKQLLMGNGVDAVKTPDIDTSDGNVTSTFA